MYSMLEDAEELGFQHVISWQSGGKSFKIHDTDVFTSIVMKSYFTQTKLKSFQRQLNIYGWKKVQVGHNKGGYFHRCFIRGSPELCAQVVRASKDASIATNGDKKYSFYNSQATTHPESTTLLTLPQHLEIQENHTTKRPSSSSSLQLDDSEIKSLYCFFYPDNHTETSSTIDPLFNHNERQHHSGLSSISDHWSTATITSKNGGGTTVMEPYDNIMIDDLDFLCTTPNDCEPLSSLDISDDTPEGIGSDVAAEEGFDDNSFPFKLHLMLENADTENYSHIVSWVHGGKAFKVHKSKEFVDRVLPMYFDQSKYESFRRQLNLYRFKRVAKGVDRGVISHPYLIQGARWLCEEVKRGRRL